MAIVRNGYVQRLTSTNHRRNGRTYRDWWLVKYTQGRNSGTISLTNLNLPPQYIGKKIRIKIEVKENENKKRL